MLNWSLVCGFSGIIITILGFIFGWIILPIIIDDKIADSVAIVNGTEQFKRFEVLPQPLNFKVYIFNVTNSEEVHLGIENPKVKEIGPYIYQKSHKKNQIKFSDDKKTVSYTQQQTFKFDQIATGALTRDDEVVVLSPHMNSIFQLAQKVNQTPLINFATKVIFNDPKTMFIKTTVQKILFDGVLFCNNIPPMNTIAKTICNQILEEKIDAITGTEEALKFAFFHHKEIKPDGLYEITTGVGDIHSSNLIKTWNGKSEVNAWKINSTCNKIEGSDGVSYQPFQRAEGKISTFITDICRSVDIYFDKEMELKSLTGYRFTPKGSFLSEIGENFSSECFCISELQDAIVQENGCLYPGALDLSNCQKAPIVLTNPHMLQTSKKYTSLIEGQTPNLEKHLTFLEVEPKTGIPLRGGKRVQFNMFLRKVDGIELTKSYKTTLMPILWVEEGIELNNEILDLLNNNLFHLVRNLYIGVLVIIAFGIVIFIGMTIIFFHRRRTGSRKFV